MMCQRIGRSPTGTIGLGRNSVSSRKRVPKPPQKITTFIFKSFADSKISGSRPRLNFLRQRFRSGAASVVRLSFTGGLRFQPVADRFHDFVPGKSLGAVPGTDAQEIIFLRGSQNI